MVLDDKFFISFSYLNDAVLALNMNDPITKEHAPKILRELLNTVQSYVQSHPNSPYNSNMRMMMMAAQSMINMWPRRSGNDFFKFWSVKLIIVWEDKKKKNQLF